MISYLSESLILHRTPQWKSAYNKANRFNARMKENNKNVTECSLWILLLFVTLLLVSDIFSEICLKTQILVINGKELHPTLRKIFSEYF